jgi:hypothetical protein
MQDVFSCKYKNTNQATKKGDIIELKNMVKNGFTISQQTINIAALYNRLDCLHYFYSIGNTFNITTAKYAASKDNIDCLVFLLNNGCPLSTKICWIAALKGSLICFKYAISKCGYDNDTYTFACKSKTIDCLKYLVDNTNFIPSHSYSFIINTQKMNHLKYLLSKGLLDRFAVMHAIVNTRVKVLDCIFLNYFTLSDSNLSQILGWYNENSFHVEEKLNTNNSFRNKMFTLHFDENKYPILHKVIKHVKYTIEMKKEYCFKECNMIPDAVIVNCIHPYF